LLNQPKFGDLKHSQSSYRNRFVIEKRQCFITTQQQQQQQAPSSIYSNAVIVKLSFIHLLLFIICRRHRHHLLFESKLIQPDTANVQSTDRISIVSR